MNALVRLCPFGEVLRSVVFLGDFDWPQRCPRVEGGEVAGNPWMGPALHGAAHSGALAGWGEKSIWTWRPALLTRARSYQEATSSSWHYY